jgi:hypothetical protein
VFPAQALWHRGVPAEHLDVVLGQGRRCPVLSIAAGGAVRWNVPHRRAWLTRSGPVAGGRGATTRVWRGLAVWQGRRRLVLPGAAVVWRGGAVACSGWLAMLTRHGRVRHIHRF